MASECKVPILVYSREWLTRSKRSVSGHKAGLMLWVRVSVFRSQTKTCQPKVAPSYSPLEDNTNWGFQLPPPGILDVQVLNRTPGPRRFHTRMFKCAHAASKRQTFEKAISFTKPSC